MSEIFYSRLTDDNFSESSLDGFVRHQNVTECVRFSGGKWIKEKNEFTEDWDAKRLREVASEILRYIHKGAYAYGAFSDGKVVGFAVVDNELFGSEKQYAELAIFQVSEPYRNHGMGKVIFEAVCNAARERHVKKLYISAHSSVESQAAYRALECVNAAEINKELAEEEPFDVQMEYVL